MDTTAVPEGTVTIVFTDVVGSTALTGRVGDEAARSLVREVEALVREQLARHRDEGGGVRRGVAAGNRQLAIGNRGTD